MTAPAGRALLRAPLLAVGMISMAWGTWLGLVRLGWNLPLPQPDQLIAHGPLMVCGFLGTLISLERAVAVGRAWTYGAPVATAAGATLILAGAPGPAGALLLTLGSALLVVLSLVLFRRAPALFTFAMTLGAVAWLAGNVLWMAGWSIHRLVFWWAAFPVLTIAGERLELSRVLRPSGRARLLFLAAIGLVAVGLVMTVGGLTAGGRVIGLGLCGLAAWLFRHDVARRTIRVPGLTRFVAVCLLTGYAWLALAGAMLAAGSDATSGPAYDAALHALFLGFVFAMIFGHAPVVFPAVLGLPVPFRPAFYGHLALLQVSLIVRLTGDLVPVLGRWRVWGGLLNAAALVLFVANTMKRGQSPLP